MSFRSNKVIVLIVITGALLLCGCSESSEHKYYKAEHSLQSQTIGTSPTKPAIIQKEKSHSHVDETKPSSNQYNSSPPQARYPFPPIPDEQPSPPKEN